eukprot:8672592-Karenia_brevis.AAC.1
MEQKWGKKDWKKEEWHKDKWGPENWGKKKDEGKSTGKGHGWSTNESGGKWWKEEGRTGGRGSSSGAAA